MRQWLTFACADQEAGATFCDVAEVQMTDGTCVAAPESGENKKRNFKSELAMTRFVVVIFFPP